MPPWRVLSVVVPAAALLVLGVAVVAAGPLPGEVELTRAMLVDRGSEAERRLSGLSELTDALPLVALAALLGALLLLGRRPVPAAVLVLGVLAVSGLNPVLKALVRRDRPPSAPAGADLSTYAFPSGHAAVSAALVLGLLAACGLPRHAWSRAVSVVAAAVVLGGVALAQIGLGRHLAADVLAGWLEAAAVLAAVRAAVSWGSGRPPVSRPRRPAPAPPG